MPPEHRPGFHRWGARALLDLKNDPPPQGPLVVPEIASQYVVRSLHRVASRWCLGAVVVDVEVGVGAGGPEVRGWFDAPCPVPTPGSTGTARRTCAVCGTTPTHEHPPPTRGHR